MLLVLCIISFVTSYEYDDSLSLKFLYSKDGVPSVAFKIGTPPQNINLELNTLVFYTNVPSNNQANNRWNRIDTMMSESLQTSDRVTLQYLNNKITGRIAYDNFY